MKKSFRINLLLVLATIFFFNVSHSQQKASDKSWQTITNEIKQKRAERDQRLQQIKLSTPSNKISKNTITQLPSASNGGQGTANSQQITIPQRPPVTNKNNKSQPLKLPQGKKE
jgi:hypothetical protein